MSVLAVLRRRLRVTDGASVSAAGMALTEGRSVKDGCQEFKDKFVEYIMASTPVFVRCTVRANTPPLQTARFGFVFHDCDLGCCSNSVLTRR